MHKRFDTPGPVQLRLALPAGSIEIEAGEPGVAVGHVLGLLALYGITPTLPPAANAAPGD